LKNSSLFTFSSETPVFIGVSRGEEFLLTLHPLFTTLHPSVSADLKSAKRTRRRNANSLEAVRVKSGEEWVKSAQTLFTPRNADKH